MARKQLCSSKRLLAITYCSLTDDDKEIIFKAARLIKKDRRILKMKEEGYTHVEVAKKLKTTPYIISDRMGRIRFSLINATARQVYGGWKHIIRGDY